MHKPESGLKNEMHEILCDFEIQTDRLISARRRDIVIAKKKKKQQKNKQQKTKTNFLIGSVAVSADHKVKIKEI